MMYTMQQTRYLLRNWRSMIENRHNLGFSGKKNAGVLFGSMKQLTREEVQTLAMKYYTSDKALHGETYKSMRDEDMAEKLSVTKKDCVKSRRLIEVKLNRIMNERSEENG